MMFTPSFWSKEMPDTSSKQGAQLGEHHRPGCMDTASFVAKPESLPLFVVFVLFGHVVINPGIPLASS